MKNILIIFVSMFAFYGVSFGQSVNNVPNSTYQTGDLVALHWDGFPNYDDLQAMVASRELLDEFDNVNYLAVIGTTSDTQIAGTTTLTGNYEHMISMFPNAIDARFKNWTSTTQTAADSWEATLNNGGTVHVAEGGPSEFTARVIEVLQDRGVVGLKRIRVVQHSLVANEASTSDNSLAIVKSFATYINIDDGNDINDTPSFNGKDATSVERNDFKERSLASEYGSQWGSAYSFVDSQSNPRSIDFSDFVGVMNIFGVATSEYSTIPEFADQFFPVDTPIVDTPVVDNPTEPVTPVVTTPTEPEASSGDVVVFGVSLSDARIAYANATNLPRNDCDRVTGGWVCANFNNPTLAQLNTSVSVDEPDVPVEPDVPFDNGDVAVIGDNLLEAATLFAEATTTKRVDCDPVGDGRWICANFNNPTIDKLTDITIPVVPVDPVEPVTPVVSFGPTVVIGNNLAAASSGYFTATGQATVDCDPVGDGRWICAGSQNPQLSQVTLDVGGTVTTQNNGVVNLGDGTIPSDALFSNGDLISVQYDSCPDPDDLHASVAGRMVLDFYGLVRNEDYIVVNGTCGFDRPRSDYITRSPEVFTKLYGDEGSTATWLNARDFSAGTSGTNNSFDTGTVNLVADKWRATLDAGNRVWVTDGGPMDFTTQVIRRLENIGYSGNYKNINVIQHSHGWNENNTLDSNLAYMAARANYVKIDNGNVPNNQTADLNNLSSDYDAALVNRYRNNFEYGDEWEIAFSILNPVNRFDGSDTVEVMWVLGLSSSDVANWNEFADAFLPTETTGGNTGGGNTGAADDLEVTQNSDTIRVQIEDTKLGAGWELESSIAGFTGSGYIRWNGGDAFAHSTAGRGASKIIINATQTGEYTLRIRAQAVNPVRSDLFNDTWFKINADRVNGSADFTDWTKVFSAGSVNNWTVSANADVENQAAHEIFKVRMTAGTTYTLEFSGRSQNHAIDYVELVKTGN